MWLNKETNQPTYFHVNLKLIFFLIQRFSHNIFWSHLKETKKMFPIWRLLRTSTDEGPGLRLATNSYYPDYANLADSIQCKSSE